MVRKRPTAEFQGRASIGAGSWDNYSGEFDLSGPLNTAGDAGLTPPLKSQTMRTILKNTASHA
ncbi:hypothetical protein CKO35_16780 [Ectothiorhodospira shaposhnikovii]|nr:hypothetical protein [Ectothiorhodospira shaposhnikovii]